MALLFHLDQPQPVHHFTTAIPPHHPRTIHSQLTHTIPTPRQLHPPDGQLTVPIPLVDPAIHVPRRGNERNVPESDPRSRMV